MRYITSLLCSTVAALLFAALFNAHFDTFGVFRSYALANKQPLNIQMKSGTDSDPRFAKPLQVISLKPQTIIVGSSRVRDGMDPDILATLAPEPIMNYGTAGMRAQEGARFIRHAIDVARVQHVIWGLDFFGFNDKEMHEMGSDGFGVLGHTFRAHDWGRLLIAYPTLSMTAGQLGSPGTTRPNGFNLAPATPAEKIDASIMRNAVGFGKAPFLYGQFTSYEAHMREVEATLAYAVRRGVTVYLYTSPLHGMVMESVFLSGAGDIFRRWKEQVTQLAHKYKMPLYDYMNYNSITTVKGSKAARYFFDGAHFTPLVSRMILSRYYTVDSQRPADFGICLTPDMLEQQWQQLLEDRKEFVAKHRAAVSDLATQLK